MSSSVATLRDAIMRASEFSGRPIGTFDRAGFEDDYIFHVMPNDSQPEGTPCYWVRKSTGEVAEKNRGNITEMMAWVKRPTTHAVRSEGLALR